MPPPPISSRYVAAVLHMCVDHPHVVAKYGAFASKIDAH